MAKLRHIALSVPDPEKAADFYCEAFDMERVGTTDSPWHAALMSPTVLSPSHYSPINRMNGQVTWRVRTNAARTIRASTTWASG